MTKEEILEKYTGNKAQKYMNEGIVEAMREYAEQKTEALQSQLTDLTNKLKERDEELKYLRSGLMAVAALSERRLIYAREIAESHLLAPSHKTKEIEG